MNELTKEIKISAAQLLNLPSTARVGPAIFTLTETALIVSVGPSRLILSAEGIILNAPRIDLNPDSN